MSELGHHKSSKECQIILGQSLRMTTGQEIDFKDSLYMQHFDRFRREERPLEDLGLPILTEPQFDSLAEKLESSIADMHRPIALSGTADYAEIYGNLGGDRRLAGVRLDKSTYEYVRQTVAGETVTYSGRVSSYNINTYRGRVYLPAHVRPVPFELASSAINRQTISLIVDSLRANAFDKEATGCSLLVEAKTYWSHSGRLKRILVFGVTEDDGSDDGLVVLEPDDIPF